MVQQVVPAVQGDGSAEPAEAPTGSAEPAEAPSSPSRRVRPHWRRELLLLVVLYLLYGAIRNLAPDQVVDAQRNARAILGAEGLLGMDVERTINLAGAALPWLAIPANYYYATMHMAVTAAVLVWLYRRRPAHYARTRAVLLTMTLMALVCYWLYPLAPPRLMTGGGYIDTGRVFTLWGVTPSDDLVALSNQYAAMPSMHVGWALWCGVAVVMLAQRRVVRVLGALYPVLTLAVVVVTGNHFVLDAVAAVAFFALASMIVTASMGRMALGAPRRGVVERGVVERADGVVVERADGVMLEPAADVGADVGARE